MSHRSLKLRFLENHVRSRLLQEADGELSQMIKSLIKATKSASSSLAPLNDPVSESFAAVLGDALKKAGSDDGNLLSRLFGRGGQGTTDPSIVKPLAVSYKATITAIDACVDRISTLASENQEVFKAVAASGGTLLDALKSTFEDQRSKEGGETSGAELSQDDLKIVQDNAQKVANEIHANIKSVLENIGGGSDIEPDDILETPLTTFNTLNDIVDKMDSVDIDNIIESLNAQAPEQPDDKDTDQVTDQQDADDESIKKAARKVALLWQASDRDQAKFVKQLMQAGLNLQKLSSIPLE